LPGYRFNYVGVYYFVKGSLIQKFVNDPDKPDIVLIKECATFLLAILNNTSINLCHR
jgi:hypothetical protein